MSNLRAPGSGRLTLPSPALLRARQMPIWRRKQMERSQWFRNLQRSESAERLMRVPNRIYKTSDAPRIRPAARVQCRLRLSEFWNLRSPLLRRSIASEIFRAGDTALRTSSPLRNLRGYLSGTALRGLIPRRRACPSEQWAIGHALLVRRGCGSALE